jgi:hypothetical protein
VDAAYAYGFFLSGGFGRFVFCGGGEGRLSGVTTLAGSLGGRPLSPDFWAKAPAVAAPIIARTINS